ncbi:MAG: hypothetical protein J5I92_10915 [Thiogranum sp.]|nr:hypothetical protein [Thiogranum sp.]
MDNPWTIGIGCSLIAAAIWYFLEKVFRRLADRSGQITASNWKIRVFAIIVSTLLFMFGNILQPAVQELLEPDHIHWNLIKLMREHLPGTLLLLLFVGGLLPGIITGLGAAKGRSLNQRIWFGISSAVIALVILDTVAFFHNRNSFLQSEVVEFRAMADFGNYYFSLLSNVFGGVVAGLVVGSATHLFACALSDSQINEQG